MRLLFFTAFRASPGRTLIVTFLEIVSSGAGTFSVLWVKLFIEAATEGRRNAVLLATAGMVGTMTISGIAGISGFTLRMKLQERVAQIIDEDVVRLSAAIPGIQHYEHPKYLDELTLLRQSRDMFAWGVGAVIHNFSIFARTMATVGLLYSVHPLLLILPLFGIPSLVGTALHARRLQKGQDETAEASRVANHIFRLSTTAANGKELRIFGLGDELIDRFRTLWAKVDRHQTRVSVQGTIIATAGWFIYALGYAGALALVAQQAVRGRFENPVATVVMVIMLAAQVNQQIQTVAFQVSWLMSSLKAVGRYFWLVDYAEEAMLDVDQPVPVPDLIENGIRLEGVSFTYPETEVHVLNDVDLFIPAGSTVAIVGENGAGKTTLVKLVSRFYEPTKGRITVDGVDIAEFDVEEWRKKIAAGFQDFARFELIARETVGVGHLPDIEDLAKVELSLVKASASEVSDTLPSGLETQLGRSFINGVELSLGQWQKLALGRTMMRESPILLVLDEPTASLDAQTEHALFERYAGAARDAAAAVGAITILISHRFSTVRMADLIIVIDGGRVTEVGSHSELMRAGKLYAELFGLQAKAYR